MAAHVCMALCQVIFEPCTLQAFPFLPVSGGCPRVEPKLSILMSKRFHFDLESHVSMNGAVGQEGRKWNRSSWLVVVIICATSAHLAWAGRGGALSAKPKPVGLAFAKGLKGVKIPKLPLKVNDRWVPNSLRPPLKTSSLNSQMSHLSDTL